MLHTQAATDKSAMVLLDGFLTIHRSTCNKHDCASKDINREEVMKKIRALKYDDDKEAINIFITKEIQFKFFSTNIFFTVMT